MKALVTVKRVLDPYVKVTVNPDGSGVDTHHAKMTINPFDEVAVEAALRLREQGLIAEIVVLSIGVESCKETLRQALALGADRAILVQTDVTHCPLNLAKIMQKIVLDETPALVLMGKQSIDGDNNQTAQMLAGLLDWPQATFASSITLTDKTVNVVCEMDNGLETYELTLPAVVSVDLRLNEPRYVSLPNIMKAKQKPLTVIELNTLGLTLREHFVVQQVARPAARASGMRVESLDELLHHLKEGHIL